ncbi:MAG: class A beta-lactamase-related serine hydrolase [Gemmatimonadota bacterium]|jgi:beta-lactamase class A
MSRLRALPIPALILYAAVMTACTETHPGGVPADPAALAVQLRDTIRAAHPEVVGLYYRSLAPEGDSVTINADVRMHAASTMKVPVMMRLFLDAQQGIRPLDATLEVTRTFRSIVDGSTFDLPPESDSDTAFYARVGQEATVRHLIDRMITWSSNLATNILIQAAEPDRVNAMLRELGADSMNVLRGVEDLKAFDAGMNNTTTARDLGVVMAAVAESDIFTSRSRDEMLSILERQHFRENIPAGLPEGTRVANKTGWITAHNHDAAVVFPDNAPPYVLTVMVKGIEDQATAAALIANLSRQVWAYHRARYGAGGA